MDGIIEQKPYLVLAYEDGTLIDLITDNSLAERDVIADKRHIPYLHKYLLDIGTKTVVVEYGYTDAYYLDDYASYYARCFRSYKKTCIRLHFFAVEFTEDEFDRGLLIGSDSDFKSVLQDTDNYLGFIIIRPLPTTVIGRTCLKNYPPTGERYFPIDTSYQVNLFGLPLTVSKTLPFQEQDSTTAACATNALWTVFHGTSQLFHHNIPTPSEITKAALSRLPMDYRDMPNIGLSDWQMAHAIRSVGLDPVPYKLKRDVDALSLFQQIVYGYLHCGIPLILNYNYPNVEIGHAVAITGYKLGTSTAIPDPVSGILLRSSRMNEIYVHDDQLGPFARMEIGVVNNVTVLILSHLLKDGTIQSNAVVPRLVLIPLYHKIRIPYESVLKAIVAYDNFIESYRLKSAADAVFSNRLQWDIHLTTVNVVKTEIANSIGLPDEYRREILLKPMPRFMWRGTAYDADEKVLDLLFDATDLDQGTFFIRGIEYNNDTFAVLRGLADESIVSTISKNQPIWTVLKWYAEQAKQDLGSVLI